MSTDSKLMNYPQLSHMLIDIELDKHNQWLSVIVAYAQWFSQVNDIEQKRGAKG